jgi:hypothetical protein
MNAISAFLYFGLPVTVTLIGWVALKLHERSAPPLEDRGAGGRGRR